MKVKDIQLNKNLKKEVKLAPRISYQNNPKVDNIDVDVNTDKANINKNDFAWAEK